MKINAPELLQRDRLKIFGSRIFFSSATDPYQYIELKYRLSRRCLQELLRYRPAKVTMHTRSHLILQDIELLKAFGSKVQVGVSITTNREDIRQQFEPSAPSIARRIELLEQLKSAGIKVYVSASPLLPCDPHEFARLIRQYTSTMWIDEMHWTEVNTQPHLLKQYSQFFQEPHYQNAVKELSREFRSADE